MIALLLSILLSAYLGIAFTFFNRYGVDLFQAIVCNYWACVITGCMVMGKIPIAPATIHEPWAIWALVMGAMFIGVFNLIAYSSIRVGVTPTQTANKLSLVIPVCFSFFMYNEEISAIKILGIAFALLAVVLVSKRETTDTKSRTNAIDYLLPIILFVSSGLIDTLTKYVQQAFLHNEALSNAYLISGFFVAASTGTLLLIYLYASGKKVFSLRNVIAGIVLGVPNYFSIYFLVKALQDNALTSSATLPINNIGVLFVVSMVGIFLFNEKLSRLNYLGLLLTLLAIAFIYIGD